MLLDEIFDVYTTHITLAMFSSTKTLQILRALKRDESLETRRTVYARKKEQRGSSISSTFVQNDRSQKLVQSGFDRRRVIRSRLPYLAFRYIAMTGRPKSTRISLTAV